LASSFINSSSILNGSNYIKQFWIEFIIIAYTCMGIFLVWFRKNFIEVHFAFADAIVALLLIIYLVFVIFKESSPLVRHLPLYYALFFFISKLILRNLEERNVEVSIRFFLNIIPFVIIGHLAMFVLQQMQISSILNKNSNVGSAFGNPDMLGSYLAVLMPFCFMQVRYWKIIGYIAFVLSLIALFSLQARTSIVAVIICGFFWVILNKQLKLKSILLLFAVPLLLGFILIYWHPESVFGRIFLWLVSIRMISVKPFGWGLLAFDKHFPQFQSSFLSDERIITKLFTPEVVHSPFNEYLNVGVTIGILALILVITFIFIIFNKLLKWKHRLLYPLLSFFIISLFYFPFKIAPLVVLIIPLVAWVSNKDQHLVYIQTSKCFAFVILLFVLISAIVLASKSFRIYNTYKEWQYSYSLSLENDSIIKAEQLYAKLYPSLKTDGRFLITYSNLLSERGKYSDALRLLEEAENYFCDITMSLNLAELYEWQGFYSRAEEKYNFAISLSPSKMIPAYEKILFLQRTGRIEEAYLASLELLNRPVEDSKYADTYIIRSRLARIIRDYETSIQ